MRTSSMSIGGLYFEVLESVQVQLDFTVDAVKFKLELEDTLHNWPFTVEHGERKDTLIIAYPQGKFDKGDIYKAVSKLEREIQEARRQRNLLAIVT